VILQLFIAVGLLALSGITAFSVAQVLKTGRMRNMYSRRMVTSNESPYSFYTSVVIYIFFAAIFLYFSVSHAIRIFKQ